jgi:hypothetical protein
MFAATWPGKDGDVSKTVLSMSSLFAALVLALAGCGGSTDDAVDESTERPGTVEVDLQEETGAAGVRAVLTFITEGRTRVKVDGLDAGEPSGGGTHPALLRHGTCDDPGSLAARLRTLRGGSSSSTVNLGLADLLSGDYSIAVLVSTAREEVIACGDVPGEA